MGWTLLALLVVLAVTILLIAVRTAGALGISMSRALALTPLKLVNRLDTRALETARAASKPTLYTISAQSHLDPAIFLAALPDDTLHVLSPEAAAHWAVSTMRGSARTVVFDKDKMIANRRLIKHLKGGGKLAVYVPPAVEPDADGFRLYRAVAIMARKTGAVIMPMRVEGSRFLPSSIIPADQSPRRRFVRLKIEALPAQTIDGLIEKRGRAFVNPANALFDAMAQLRFQSADLTGGLHGALVRAAKIYGPGRIILEDAVTGALAYKRTLIGARVLGKRFMDMSEPGEAMGVLLPNANGAVISFFALQSAGRVAAMLNYSAGPANVVSAVKTGAIRTVITSRAFIEKAELQSLIDALEANGTDLVWLEDVRETVTTTEKLSAAVQWARPLAPTDPEKAAVILFTSGTEGAPKGVVLSHRNLIYNAAQSEARVTISVQDCLFNVLPLFHSFGLTGGMVLPLLYGVKLFLYPSPLHYKLIPQVAAKVKPTIMFGTDTFLAGYARTAKDTDFASLRFVVAGAEAVKPETEHVYEERFGCHILEGYGMTEASPVVAVNSATHTRTGTVGRPLSGIDIRLEPVDGIEHGARMWVRGPNVMLGYMKVDKPGVLQPISDGWHDSGDIVDINSEGFIEIRGRAKRFAKIGGEMVSLGAVEMLAQSLWPEDRHAAVTLADRRKGEKIVLATTAAHPDKKQFATHTHKNGQSKLMVPADFVKMEEIPVLGSGKTDYVSTTDRVMEMLRSISRAAGRSRRKRRGETPDGATSESKPEETQDRQAQKEPASSK